MNFFLFFFTIDNSVTTHGSRVTIVLTTHKETDICQGNHENQGYPGIVVGDAPPG